MKNPLTPEQQQQALQHMQQPVDPIVTQPTQHSAPAIIPHLQSIYGEKRHIFGTSVTRIEKKLPAPFRIFDRFFCRTVCFT